MHITRLLPIQSKSLKGLCICALAGVLVIPEPAHAKPGLGNFLGLLTSPFRVFGHGFARRHHHPLEPASQTLASHQDRNSEPKPPTTEPSAPATEARAEPEPVPPQSQKSAPPSPAPHESSRSAAAAPPPRESSRLVMAASPLRESSRSVTVAPPWPTSSASAYENIISYVLRPAPGADRLWSHGYSDIVSAALASPAEAPPGSDQTISRLSSGMCSDQARQLADRSVTQIAASLALTPAQRDPLDQLRAAVGEAIDRGRAAICNVTPAAQADRFKQMTDGLWTMWDAAIMLRAPLQRFYDSLSDEQKAKLAATAPVDQGVAKACREQRTPDWPADRTDHTAGASNQPADDQQAMQQRLPEMAKFLLASCPRGSEPTPMSRLAAVSDRMNALLYVTMSMDPTFTAGGSSP